MTSSISPQFPQISDEQQIGQLATQCFSANRPTTWIEIPTSGDGDFGFDYLIQIREGSQIKWVFKAQLKGTKSPQLNAAGNLFSISLKTSTVRYYQNTTEPILLVLADLSIDPKPKNCPLYYVWIDQEVKQINDRLGGDIPPGQEHVTFHVPKANFLDNDTDLSPEIEHRRRISQLGKSLHEHVEKKLPGLDLSGQIAISEQIPDAISRQTPDQFNIFLDSTESLWPEPKIGMRSWFLTEAIKTLRAGKIPETRNLLRQAREHTDPLLPIEEAESLYIEGKIHSFNEEDAEASSCYARAHALAPSVEKYVASWGEMELKIHYKDPDIENAFPHILEKLTGTSSQVLSVKVRVLAAEKRHTEAIEAANKMTSGRYAALATVFVMDYQFSKAVQTCDEGLAETPLKEMDKQALRLLRARAKFYLATDYQRWKDPNAIYPITGTTSTNIPLLKEAWTDTEYLIEQFRCENWPPNTNLISDLWCSIGSVLNKQKETLPILKEAAKHRNSVDLNSTLELLAFQAQDFPTALWANERLPENGPQIMRRVHILHSAHRHSEVVTLLSEKLPNLDRNHELFGPALLMGMLSAEKIIRTDVANEWRRILEDTPSLAEDYAVYAYFNAINQDPRSKPAAFQTLRNTYERLNKPTFIGIHLFHELNAGITEQAEEICTLASELESYGRKLSVDALLHLTQAYSTLGKWEELLTLSERAIEQFESHSRVKGIRAFSLDRLGRTAEARESLRDLIEAGLDEPFAINTYLNIVGRSGFINEGITLVEKIIATETDSKKRLQGLQLLFNLLHYQDPQQSRCLDVLLSMSDLIDQDKEDEEGPFLVKFISNQVDIAERLSEETLMGLQKRLDNFFKKFPNSPILSRGTLPDSNDPHAIIAAIEKMIGATSDQQAYFKKIENELRTGTVPFTYAWRPRQVLRNIPDLPHLWECGKKSKVNEQQYHLTMVINDFSPTTWDKIKDQVPLFDLISLLILQDLNLLEDIFKIFPKIAVSQATIVEISDLTRPMSGSLFRRRCSELQQFLQEHFSAIEQPYCPKPKEDSFAQRNWDTHEVRELVAKGKYVLYSDDVLFRIYCQVPQEYPAPICTLDLLAILEERGILSESEVAHKIALLCSWKVSIVISNRHAVAAIPQEITSARSVKGCLAILQAGADFSAIYNSIWDIALPHQTLLGNMGSMAGLILSSASFRSYDLAAFLITWSNKSALRTDIHIPKITALMQAVLQIAFSNPDLTDSLLKKLISAYSEAIEFIHGDHMDERTHTDSLKSLAAVAANEDIRLSLQDEKSLGKRLARAFTPGTSESDLFGNAYTEKYIGITAKRDN